MNLPDASHFERLLDEADTALADDNLVLAQNNYLYVGDAIEAAVKQEQTQVNWLSTSVGAVIGGLIAGPIGFMLGAAGGFMLNKDRTMGALVDTPYFEVYQRATNGLFNVQRAAR